MGEAETVLDAATSEPVWAAIETVAGWFFGWVPRSLRLAVLAA